MKDKEPASCVATMLSMESQAVPMEPFKMTLSESSGDFKDTLYDQLIYLCPLSKVNANSMDFFHYRSVTVVLLAAS